MSAGWETGLRPGAREVEEAAALMQVFAARTGLDDGRPPRRYLWTDAFAVCNDLALARATGETRHVGRALRLVDQVHGVLGRHREDDPRQGWISGLGEQEGASHPTAGGLRIGKRLPERPPDAPFDERLEWDRDGQYFHYLTRWMHALDQVARATGEVRFNRWARELADVAHRAFTRAGPRAMAWKLSIDLSRALVPSMGQHDPLDGWITCLQLQATAAALEAAGPPALDAALRDFAHRVDVHGLATADPLGLGGLLVDAARVAQLREQEDIGVSGLLQALLAAARLGLDHFARQHDLDRPASQRLAFRELGLAIGLAGLAPMREALAEGGRGSGDERAILAQLDALAAHAALGARIRDFWRDPEARANPTWAEHADIDEVMLATCLVPAGVLVLRPVGVVGAGGPSASSVA